MTELKTKDKNAVDAERYRFLRDENNWIERGCAYEETWQELTESTMTDFDRLVDKRMERVGK